MGDVNASGTRNVADALCAILAALAEQGGGSAAGLACLSAGVLSADLSCNGVIDLIDVQACISLALAGGIPSGLAPGADGCPAACASCAPPGGASCFIGGACVPEGARVGADDCQVCDPTEDPASYTTETGSPYYRDADLDGAGDSADSQVRCTPTGEYTAALGGDCDDTEPAAYPGNAEVCDGVDNDCNGQVDEVGCGIAGRSCLSILQANPGISSGVYTLDPDGAGSNPPFQAYCDMTTDGGGWALMFAYAIDDPTPFNHLADGFASDVDVPLDPDTSASGNHDFAKFSALASPEMVFRFTNNKGRPHRYERGGAFSDWTNAPVECAEVRVIGGDNNGAAVDSSFTGAFSTPARGNGHSHLALVRGAGCNQESNDTEGLGLRYVSVDSSVGAWVLIAGTQYLPGSGAAFQLWFRESFHPAGSGASAATPGTSCLAILEGGFSEGDGEYWIDPDGDGAATQPTRAYCDMTTDGGGWTALVQLVGNDEAGESQGADRFFEYNWSTDRGPTHHSATASYVRGSLYTALESSATEFKLALIRVSDGATGHVIFPLDAATRPFWNADSTVSSSVGTTLIDEFGVQSTWSQKLCKTADGHRSISGQTGLTVLGQVSGNPQTLPNTNCDFGPWDTQILLFPNPHPSSTAVSVNFGGGPYAQWSTGGISHQYAVREHAPLGWSAATAAASCYELVTAVPTAESGVYWLDPPGDGAGAFQAYCDMDTDGGGWTLIGQFRPWTDLGLQLCVDTAVGTMTLDDDAVVAPAKLSNATINGLMAAGWEREILMKSDEATYTGSVRSGAWPTTCSFDLADTYSFHLGQHALTDLESTAVTCTSTAGWSSWTITEVPSAAGWDVCGWTFSNNTTQRHIIWTGNPTYTASPCTGGAGRTWAGTGPNQGCRTSKLFVR